MLTTLYYKDAYCREFISRAVSCVEGKRGFEIVLEETAFYPEGGGQPADIGTVNGIRVLDTRKKDGVIVHICEEPLLQDEMVTGKIDWQRRFRHMQQHSGEHIFSGIVHELYGYDNVGFHMGKEFVTVDFNGTLTMEQVREAERLSNEVVFADKDIRITYPQSGELSRLDYRSKKELDGEVRIVTVPGADVCACCGTHVKRTGEIGVIKAVGQESHKGGIRLILQIGWAALEDYEKKLCSVRTISGMLSAKPDEIAQAVEKLHDSMEKYRFQMTALKRQMLGLRVQMVPEGTDHIFIFEEGLDSSETRVFCDMLIHKVEKALVLTGNDIEGYKYVLGAKDTDITSEGKDFNAACDGRGGGRGNMVQGSVGADRKTISDYAKRKMGLMEI